MQANILLHGLFLSNPGPNAGGLRKWERITKRQTASLSFHWACKIFTIIGQILFQNLKLIWPFKDVVFVFYERGTGLEKVHIYFQSRWLTLTYVTASPTVRVVLLPPREPVQFIISFLLHNKSVSIGFKEIFTWSTANLLGKVLSFYRDTRKQKRRNVPLASAIVRKERKIASQAQRMFTQEATAMLTNTVISRGSIMYWSEKLLQKNLRMMEGYHLHIICISFA